MSALGSVRVGVGVGRHSLAQSRRPGNPLILSSHTVPILRANTPAQRTLFYLPVVLQPAFWRSLVPSFLRRGDPADHTPIRRRPWNPATYFIWMFLLIGSQAVQLITLRTGFDKFSRDTERQLKVLRDVVRRVKAGEDVDVRKELGTGNPRQEQQWEDVMAEVAAEDAVFQQERKRREAEGEKRHPRELSTER